MTRSHAGTYLAQAKRITLPLSRCLDCGERIRPDQYGNGAVCSAHPTGELVAWPREYRRAEHYIHFEVARIPLFGERGLMQWLWTYDESLYTGAPAGITAIVAEMLLRWGDITWGPIAAPVSTGRNLYG